MPNPPKVYDFSVAKVEEQLVSYLKSRRGESTVADMIAATGLPKYQVEQAARLTLDEYAGRLKVAESGELLYYFPSGMRSTIRGPGPSLRRAWRAFAKAAVRVLSFLFKVWIVAMLVGYFVAFLALAVVAILGSVAASAAGGRDGKQRSRGSGSGFGGMYLFVRLLDLVLRMWIWSSLLKDQKRPQKAGRPFYRSVFGFVFGEGDPNRDWNERERKYVLSYIRGKKGVITLEELMALTGKESDEANALLNRYLVEFEGEPGVTEKGTLIFFFPALLRTSGPEQRSPGEVPLVNPSSKRLVPFSENPRRTNGWIAFFNAFNLAFGSYFLAMSLTQGAGALASSQGSWLYSFAGHLLARAGAGTDGAVALMSVALGVIPVAFSLLFFLVPLVRAARLRRSNEGIKEETLRRRIYAHVLSSPARVDPNEIRPAGAADPKGFEAARKRILERFAALAQAEVVAQEKEQLVFRFGELERARKDLEEYRGGVDLKKFEVGETVFDSGQ